MSQHCCNCIGGKFRAVECRVRKSAKRFGKRFGGKRAGFSECPLAELLRKKRSARNRGRAAAAQKTRFDNAFPFDAHGKLQNVAANGIADFYFGVRARQLTGVARILKMVKNGVAKHHEEYSNARFYFFAGRYFLSIAAITT